MYNKGIKIAAATLASIIIAGGFSIDTQASGIMTDMPGAGIAVVLSDTVLATETVKAEENTTELVQEETKEDCYRRRLV